MDLTTFRHSYNSDTSQVHQGAKNHLSCFSTARLLISEATPSAQHGLGAIFNGSSMGLQWVFNGSQIVSITTCRPQWMRYHCVSLPAGVAGGKLAHSHICFLKVTASGIVSYRLVGHSRSQSLCIARRSLVTGRRLFLCMFHFMMPGELSDSCRRSLAVALSGLFVSIDIAASNEAKTLAARLRWQAKYLQHVRRHSLHVTTSGLYESLNLSAKTEVKPLMAYL